jgi:photosynthetic reaction center H subunit
MAEYEEGRLYKLSELDDYEVADDDPDVRGWDVVTSDNKTIGEVEDLIVDMSAMRVRYLQVRVKDEISGVDDHRMLLPIGTASIDEKKDVVRAGNVETVTLLKYPKLEEGNITRDYENTLRRSYNPDFETKDSDKESDKDYYNNEFYDEERFYSPRRKKNLFRLHEMHGYEIQGVDPDIRNWEVVSRDGKKIGKVYELIVDPKAKKIRYVEIASEIDRGTADEDQHILLPVGLTSLDEDSDKVTVRVDYSELSRYPLYRGGEISRTYEDTLRNSIRMDSLTSRDPDDEYYNNEYYNDQGFYGKRGGGVRWV